MTPKEIRDKSIDELGEMLKNLRSELFNLKMQKSSGQLEKYHRLPEIRHEIARVQTIKKEKQGKAA